MNHVFIYYLFKYLEIKISKIRITNPTADPTPRTKKAEIWLVDYLECKSHNNFILSLSENFVY